GGLVCAGDLGGGVDGDQLGDRLGHHDGTQAGVLVEHRGVDDRDAGGQKAELAPLEGDDAPQVLVEVEVGDVADELREVVLPRGGGGVALLLHVQAGQGERLVVAQGELPGLVQGQAADGRGGRLGEAVGKRLCRQGDGQRDTGEEQRGERR